MKRPAGTRRPRTVGAPPALADASVPDPILDVVRKLRSAGHPAYLVGGCVRDLLRDARVKDYDVATSAIPAEVKQLFRRVVPTGIAHGTVTVLTNGGPVEVTTFRGEGQYLDGRHPSAVKFLTDIREDLSRRDFTINAMAYDPTTSEFVDPFGGLSDLRRRIVRCVGDPAERFAEDGLRPLRAVRFASTLQFSIESKTKAAIPRALETFRRVATERIREEFSRILMGPAPGAGLEYLADAGLLSEFLPELASGSALAHAIATVGHAPPTLEVRLSALLHFAGRAECEPGGGGGSAVVAAAILERLRYPRRVIQLGELLVGGLPLAEEVADDDRALRRLLSRIGVAHVEMLCALVTAHARASSRKREEAVRRAEHLTRRLLQVRDARPPLATTDLALKGTEAMALLGEKPGPRIGELLRYLLDRVLDDPSLNAPETLRELARGWAARDRI